MSDIKIVQCVGWGTCECCGSYDWCETVFVVDGHEHASYWYDGHLSGGYRFEDVDAVADLLRTFGHTVTIEETNDC